MIRLETCGPVSVATMQIEEILSTHAKESVNKLFKKASDRAEIFISSVKHKHTCKMVKIRLQIISIFPFALDILI